MPVLPAPAGPTHDIGSARFTSLATPSRGARETAVWRVAIDPGAPAVPHRLTREEVFIVLEGRATATIDGATAVAGPGDAIVVPPDTPFAIANDSPGVLQMVCCLPVGGQAVMADEAFTPPWAQ
jgi:quercetin dioxygenase-like cupin family protein